MCISNDVVLPSHWKLLILFHSFFCITPFPLSLFKIAALSFFHEIMYFSTFVVVSLFQNFYFIANQTTHALDDITSTMKFIFLKNPPFAKCFFFLLLVSLFILLYVQVSLESFIILCTVFFSNHKIFIFIIPLLL